MKISKREKELQVRADTIREEEELPAFADGIYKQLDLDGLTRRQRLFVLKYDGRRPAAVASDAGYKNPGLAANRLMSNSAVMKNIKIIADALEKSMVASSTDILVFWTKIMDNELGDEGFDAKDRITASDKLARYRGLIHSGNAVINQKNKTIQVSIMGLSRPTTVQKVTEAEYTEIPPDIEKLL